MGSAVFVTVSVSIVVSSGVVHVLSVFMIKKFLFWWDFVEDNFHLSNLSKYFFGDREIMD